MTTGMSELLFMEENEKNKNKVKCFVSTFKKYKSSSTF